MMRLTDLKKMGVLSKVDYSDWALPTVYIKKKSKEIYVCEDFSNRLNDACKSNHYPLLGPEQVFVQLSGGQIFLKN